MKKLYRSVTDKKLTGLCGGVGEYFNLDPTVIRVITLILTFFSVGTVLFIYLLASIFIPKSPYSHINDPSSYHYR
ncbi:PspC domain-containing protein [Paenibacillus yanchengensis]|uniref:PspC domain-containing protein n=1 Tax=Paenibacillus yanchengensis TaxID=2035833 RepID=A0ABW4YGR8_9BACL